MSAPAPLIDTPIWVGWIHLVVGMGVSTPAEWVWVGTATSGEGVLGSAISPPLVGWVRTTHLVVRIILAMRTHSQGG